MARGVRQAIMAEFHVPLTTLVLIRPERCRRRRAARSSATRAGGGFLAGELDAVARWDFAAEGEAAVEQARPADAPLPGVEEIRDWLRGRIAAAISVPVEEISDDEPLGHYIMDSITLTAIARDVEVWLGRRFNPTVLFDSPTLAVLAERLLDPVYQVEGSPAAVEGMSEAGTGCRPGATVDRRQRDGAGERETIDEQSTSDPLPGSAAAVSRWARGRPEVPGAGDQLRRVRRHHGPSGSGKSTLLNLLGGLDRPTAGTIWFDSQPLKTASQLDDLRVNKVGYVFQAFTCCRR